jgi:hypothetical protein
MFDDESVKGALERIDEWECSTSRRADQAQAPALVGPHSFCSSER